MSNLTFSDFRGGRGENFAAISWPREKRAFTQKCAYVYEKYAELKIRIWDPRPKVTQLPYAQRYLRSVSENIVQHARRRRAAADL